MARKMNQADLNRWIGKQICRERSARNISQEALSELAGVSRHFISLLENGNRAARVDTYYSIASAFGISLGELFRGNDVMETTDDILYLLSDCSLKEIQALTEILRVSKIQLSLFR